MSDLISRQAAIDALGEAPEVWTDSPEEFAALNQWEMDVVAIKAVPSARPTGRWTKIVMTLMNNQNGHLNEWECDQCHEHQLLLSNFCPNCGAKMEVPNAD